MCYNNIIRKDFFMITLKIENENIEKIFLNEFHSNKEKFFEFIQSSYDKVKDIGMQNDDSDLIKMQELSMKTTWDNEEDKVWDEL